MIALIKFSNIIYILLMSHQLFFYLNCVGGGAPWAPLSLEHHLVGGYVRYISPHIIIIIIILESHANTIHPPGKTDLETNRLRKTSVVFTAGITHYSALFSGKPCFNNINLSPFVSMSLQHFFCTCCTRKIVPMI